MTKVKLTILQLAAVRDLTVATAGEASGNVLKPVPTSTRAGFLPKTGLVPKLLGARSCRVFALPNKGSLKPGRLPRRFQPCLARSFVRSARLTSQNRVVLADQVRAAELSGGDWPASAVRMRASPVCAAGGRIGPRLIDIVEALCERLFADQSRRPPRTPAVHWR
jgi:hypothetical protein